MQLLTQIPCQLISGEEDPSFKSDNLTHKFWTSCATQRQEQETGRKTLSEPGREDGHWPRPNDNIDGKIFLPRCCHGAALGSECQQPSTCWRTNPDFWEKSLLSHNSKVRNNIFLVWVKNYLGGWFICFCLNSDWAKEDGRWPPLTDNICGKIFRPSRWPTSVSTTQEPAAINLLQD